MMLMIELKDVDMQTNHHLPPPRGAHRWLTVLAWLAIAGPAATADPAERTPADAQRGQRAGRLIRVTAPITTGLARRVSQEAAAFVKDHQGHRPVIVFEIQPGQSSFGDAYELARAILRLSGATTVLSRR